MLATTVELGNESLSAISRQIDEWDEHPTSETEVHAGTAATIASLPAELVQHLIDFRDGRLGAALLVKGLPQGKMAAVPTPSDPPNASRTMLGFHRLSVGVLGVLGEPYAYESQQNGRLINNIAPRPGNEEDENHGIGSKKGFDLHSEDAFMQYPPSYLQLSCVRNPTATPTIVSGLRKEDLGEWALPLHENSFVVKTNPAQRKWGDHRLVPGPVLWGSHERPFLRYNSVATEVAPGSPKAATTALERLRRTLQDNVEAIQSEPGDILIVNNRLLCHARSGFPARFDGADRWLLRIVAYRDPCVVAPLTRYAPYPMLAPEAA